MVAQPDYSMTADEFAALPNDGLRLELIKGELVAMAPAFEDHGETSMRIAGYLYNHVIVEKLGKMYASTGFLLGRDPDTVRAPDAAFIQKSRLISNRGQAAWVQVVPDLVVEVVSSGDRASAIAQKVQMWLDAGVRLVWVAYPVTNTLVVHRRDAPPQILNREDTLDGGEVLPGFRLPVAQAFGDEES